MTCNGKTHYRGCECHEMERDTWVEMLKAENDRLRLTLERAESYFHWLRFDSLKYPGTDCANAASGIHEEIKETLKRGTRT